MTAWIRETDRDGEALKADTPGLAPGVSIWEGLWNGRR
jgi:hypothetical protein